MSNQAIVLAAIQMPGMTGLELSAEIRKFWPYCRVIFLTAYNEFDYFQKALRQGSLDYLLKTEDNAMIVQAVKRAAAQLDEAREKPLMSCGIAHSDADPALELVSRINLHVLSHLDQDLTVATLVRMVFLNPDYLSRLYKQTTRMNLYDYITGIKVEESRRLLRDSDLKIHEVAEKVGFLSREYFSRFIRKHAGMTPQELRDKLR